MLSGAKVASAKKNTKSSAPPASGNTPNRKRLGDRLIDAGYITAEQLELTLREQKRSKRLLGELLVDLGFVSAEVITKFIASESKTEIIDVQTAVIDSDVLDLVDYEFARQYQVLPLSLDGDVFTIALADAYNVIAIDQIEKNTGYDVRVVTAAESDIAEALTRHYAQGQSINDTVDLIISKGVLPDEEDATQNSPLVRLVEQLIALGIKQKATDIHIEPDEKVLRIRQRVDGVLRQEALIPKAIQNALIARIKLISGLNITEKRIPQDGRIKFLYGQMEVDLRASTLPTNHGESVVLRILNNSNLDLELKALGFNEQDEQRFVDVTERPYGMILVTGPTGSGKTTTLYTALSQVDTERRSVFTLEDPIEYTVGQIRQTQVRPEVGMDFAAGLRALLRQDPDVILIGEIRDTETAQLATRAALTGHLVLSTLHTNTAVGVIPRLIDMGVESYLIPPALSAVIGQRLVRRICDECKQPLENTAEKLERLQLSELLDKSGQLWHSQGCPACNHTGYKGRQAIYEVMLVNEDFHDAIVDGANVVDLLRLAKEGGMQTMLEDGVKKALQGITTVEEVIRVVR